MKRGNYKIADPTGHVSCRVQLKTLEEMKEIGKPGSICSWLIREFFPLRKILKNLHPDNQVLSENGHIIYFTRIDGSLLMHIKKNDLVVPVEMSNDLATQLALTLLEVAKSK